MRALVWLWLLAGCKGAAAPKDAPARPPAGPALGTFTLTYYWVADEREAAGRRDTPVYDVECAVLASVSAEFASALAMSGTGRLVDGRTLAVMGDCPCPRSPCSRVLDPAHAWGVGARNRPLVPFRSLAVDRAVIPIGTPLWIPDLAGVDLPGYWPSVHDGCVTADDTGGRMIGHKVDWFVGTKRDYLEIDRVARLREVVIHDAGARCR